MLFILAQATLWVSTAVATVTPIVYDEPGYVPMHLGVIVLVVVIDILFIAAEDIGMNLGD